MLGPLPYTLEVGLDLALQLEAVAARAALKWVLDDIAAQLCKIGQYLDLDQGL
jgi:hypothetical protein